MTKPQYLDKDGCVKLFNILLNDTDTVTRIAKAQAIATAAEDATEKANEASKTATDYITNNEGEIVVGEQSDGDPSGAYVVIGEDSFDICDADGNLVARYGANTIDLGVDSDEAQINLLGRGKVANRTIITDNVMDIGVDASVPDGLTGFCGMSSSTSGSLMLQAINAILSIISKSEDGNSAINLDADKVNISGALNLWSTFRYPRNETVYDGSVANLTKSLRHYVTRASNGSEGKWAKYAAGRLIDNPDGTRDVYTFLKENNISATGSGWNRAVVRFDFEDYFSEILDVNVNWASVATLCIINRDGAWYNKHNMEAQFIRYGAFDFSSVEIPIHIKGLPKEVN